MFMATPSGDSVNRSSQTRAESSHAHNDDPIIDEPLEEEDSKFRPRPPEPPPTTDKAGNGPWFSFDITNPRNWRDKVHEFGAWIDLQMTKSNRPLQNVLREFTSLFTGTLRDWYQSFGEYRQLQLVQSPSASHILGIIFKEFIGDFQLIDKQARQEYFEMKCCSLKRKDLNFHFKKISHKYYMLNGLNDETLRQVYINSLPDELQAEIHRHMASTRRDLRNTSLGEIH
ncbi:hypothetical protein ACOSQ3_009472 [Xanthoceras sorbifolium]